MRHSEEKKIEGETDRQTGRQTEIERGIGRGWL